MDDVLKILCFLPLTLYYILESLVLAVIPKRLRYKSVTGEIALITGGGSGIGREMAVRFAKLGCRVVLVDIDLRGMQETKKMIGGDPDLISVVLCDVSKREDVYTMAKKVKEEVGVVTILVNNAGIVTGKKFLECPDDMIIKTFEVNALAHFWTCKAFLPDMIAENHGHIVSIASLAGLTGAPRLTDYCASKHAAVGFEESLRVELEADGKTGVKSTVVCPCHITTGLFEGFKSKLLKSVTPEYIADEIISAVRVNQEIVIIPRYALLGIWLKHMLPVSAMRLLHDITGLNICMDDFRGRVKKQ